MNLTLNNNYAVPTSKKNINFKGEEKEKKPVLFTTDLDGTLINWKKNPAWKHMGERQFDKKAFNEVLDYLHQNSSDFKVMFNTARNLDEFRELGPFFQNRKTDVDFISLKNGKL